MQMLMRFILPSMSMRLLCTLGLKKRLVRGALRTHLEPRVWWRMLRPNLVRLSQTSHLPEAMAYLRLSFNWSCRVRGSQG